MSWLVLRITKGRGTDAERKLKEANVFAYDPVETFIRVHRRDKTKTPREQTRSLFPGYLFVSRDHGGTPEALDLNFILGPQMRASFMSFNNRYLMVSNKDVDGVRAVEDRIREDARAQRPNAKVWTPGDSITLLRGVLAGSMGTILAVRKRNLLVGLKQGGQIFVDVAMVKPLAR